MMENGIVNRSISPFSLSGEMHCSAHHVRGAQSHITLHAPPLPFTHLADEVLGQVAHHGHFGELEVDPHNPAHRSHGLAGLYRVTNCDS